jgi:hypothetical protein
MGKNKAKGWGTYPQYRAYEITWTKAALKGYREQIVSTVKLLEKALKLKKPKLLPLCRDWKCGEGNCGHWAKCKPEGRYNTKKWSK